MTLLTSSPRETALRQPRIGSQRLNSPFVQAALSGYSDRPMRTLARRHGAAYTLAEVMLERFVNEVRGSGRTGHYLHVAEEDHPVGAQLMGAEPAAFGPAARRLADAGFDVIDINFGCPVRTALGGCRGGYHLGQPDVALQIVSEVRAAVGEELPVTLKMRRGLDDGPESRRRFFEILGGAFDLGVAAVTVHARTVEQKYRGPADWGFLAEVKQFAGEKTIFGSGDLFTAAACVEMLRRTGVDGVSIARGAIGNPWIFQQAQAVWRGQSAPAPTISQQRAAIEEHRRLAEETYGPERWLGRMRKFGFRYAERHPQFPEVRDAFAAVRDADDWRRLLQEFYDVDDAGAALPGPVAATTSPTAIHDDRLPDPDSGRP